MAGKRELATRNAVDGARNLLLSRVPDMIALLDTISSGQEALSHNATSKDWEAFRAVTQDRKVQLTAVNSWLDRAGVIPPKAQTERGADIQLAEMTVTELRRLADTLDGEIAERAKVVPSTLADTVPAASIEDIM